MFPGTTILDYLFWMFMGALQVFVVQGLVAWLKHFGKKVVWWQVALMYGGFATLCLVIAGGTTLMGECESIAGWYFIGVLGLPVVIAMAILVRIFFLKKPAAALRDGAAEQPAPQGN